MTNPTTDSDVQENPVAATSVDTVAPQKRPRKPDRRRALTRRAIVQAATRLFAEQGVDLTTVDEIAEAAQLSVGTLYFHFGSKDGVLRALVGDVLDSSAEYLSAARQSDSPLERLLESGDVYFRFAMEQPVAFRFVAAGLPALSSEAPVEATTHDADIDTRVAQFVGSVATDLSDAMEAGEISREPLDEALAFIWGAWNGVAALTMRSDSFAISADVAERALKLGRRALVTGLGGTPPS